MIRSFLPMALLFLVLPVTGQGQTKVPEKVPEVPLDKKDGTPAKGAMPPGSAAKEGKDPKESPRMQRLRQLSFDRRSSAILKAWAFVPDKEPPKKEEKKDPKKEEKKDPKKEDVEALKLDKELAEFQRDVTTGQWGKVKTYLAKLPADEGLAGYKQLVEALASPFPMGRSGGPPMMGPMNPQMMQFGEKNKFAPADVIGLAAASPKELDKEGLAKLGAIMTQAIADGHAVEHAVASLQKETARPKGQAVLTTRQAAKLLAVVDQGAHIGPFLPPLADALAAKDHEGLNLLTHHYLALYAKDKKSEQLEKAWSATLAVLAVGNVARAEVEEALKRAVEIAPKLRAELGQKWLEQSFTKEPQRGMDILATIGTHIAQGLQFHPMVPELRLKTLQLQKTAVDALLRAAPDKAAAWQSTLSLLAGSWLKEADFSYRFDQSTNLHPYLRRDRWGNLYYFQEEPMHPGMMHGQRPDMPRPIVTGELLETRPTDPWLKHVEASLTPKLAMQIAQLYLKVNEEQKAFPYIEQVAKKQRESAKELVNEFLRVWTRNHNPNASREYTNPYMFMYGFERRAESIPLTRSKQERNLVELAELVKRLRALQVGEVDETLLAKAFTTCHSSAEVYRLEAIETVFGPLKGLKPKTLGELAQQMRENLGGLWRLPSVQEDKKTKRKTKDIQAEVLRGYALARAVIEQGIKTFPTEWALVQAQAALLHDENNFHQELAKSSEFSPRRQQALADFQKAAALYAAQVKDLSTDDETTKVYEQWFYAGLGACDLNAIKEDKLPETRQPALIRKAILALPGEAAERHMGKFANALFTRLSSVNPAVKYRYLKAGFEIVGDHKLAHEARKVHDYYKDLVSEIKLETILDGSSAVGHQQPFGVFVNLRHTRDIERESGGFGRYLQNQNSNLYFSYNYGRPTEDYRDKFQATVTEALKEHFEVISVAFQSDKVNSRALPEYGWRFTPYAYLLLKARGPQVDKLPPLRLDLDFLDTSGYVVLPIESPTLPLDASGKGQPRPYRKLQVTQILDERQSDKGKLLLEIKATAQGLVPPLDEVLDIQPAEFDIVKTDDHGVSVARFDPDAEQNVVQAERTWLLTLQAKPGLDAAPTNFAFGQAKADTAEMVYQRYKDADLVNAVAEVALEEHYASANQAWLWWLGAAVACILFLVAGTMFCLRRQKPAMVRVWELPERLTPFTVLALLKKIEQANGFSETKRGELRQAILRLEQHYFAADGNGEIDLQALAATWAGQAK